MTEFTEEEIEALKEMVEEWISEGFTTPPFEPAVASVIHKLGLSKPGR